MPVIAQASELLGSARIAQLADPVQRAAWERYVTTSRAQAELDRRSMEAELAPLGLRRWTPAPEAPAFIMNDSMTDVWFRSSEARRIADNMLSFQTPSGGWSKRIDLRGQPRRPGESYGSADGWSYIATFDNDATTEQIRFLARVHAAQPDARYQRAIERGLDYVFRAQFPNGCWPQVYPLQGGYHDAATFNDDVTFRVLALLRAVTRAEIESTPELRQRAATSLQQGIDCILASQVIVNGTRTVWGAQHDPLTLQPVQARAYEHASLSGGESVNLVEFLMLVDSPDARIRTAVHAAATWFRTTAIHGFTYGAKGELARRNGAGPIWARFYEIGTNRPIFSNRDGVVLYDWNQLESERKYGYAWFRDSPIDALRKYDRWVRRHPPA